MSLIADALKKAQSSRFSRRYLSPEPTGVLPAAKETRHDGWQSILSSFSDRFEFSPALLVGLGAGVVVFVALFTYLFYGRGDRVKSPPTAVAGGDKKTLILAPPPAVPAVEPLPLEKETALPGTVAASTLKGESASQLPRGAKEGAKASPGSPEIQGKTKEGSKTGESTTVTVAPNLSEEVRYHFNLALFYQEERNLQQARREYEKVIQLWPLYAEAYNNLGVVYKELGLYDEALAQMKKALALNPRYTKAFHNLGAIYQIKGDLRQATKNYEIALSLDRKHLSSYNNLGLLYRAENRPHEAIGILEKALAIDASFAQTHYNLALVLEQVGELERAQLHYQKFIDLSGDGNRSLAEKVRAHLQAMAR